MLRVTAFQMVADEMAASEMTSLWMVLSRMAVSMVHVRLFDINKVVDIILDTISKSLDEYKKFLGKSRFSLN